MFTQLKAGWPLAGLVLLIVTGTTRLAAQGTGSTPAAKPAEPSKNIETAARQAEDAQDVINRREAAINQLIEEFKKRTAEVKPGNFATENLALDAARRLMPKLREEGKWILNNQAQLNDKLQLLKASLQKAATSYQELGGVYRQHAAQEDDEKFKEDYVELAGAAERLAEVMVARAEGIDGVRTQVAKELKMVEKIVVFIERVEPFLRVAEGAAKQGIEVQANLERLRKYLKDFEETMKTLKGLTAAMAADHSPSSSQVPSSEPKKATPPKSSKPETPTNSKTGAAIGSSPVLMAAGMPSAREAAKSIPGKVIQVACEKGHPDLAVLDVGARHGVHQNALVYVYQPDGNVVWGLKILSVGEDKAFIQDRAGRLRKGDGVSVWVEATPSAVIEVSPELRARMIAVASR